LGTAGQSAAGTSGAAGAAGSHSGAAGSGSNVGGAAGTLAGTGSPAAGSGATAGMSGTLPDAGPSSAQGAYQPCDASASACPDGMLCVHPGEGVDQESGPTLCTPACTPPSLGNPSPPNDCPAAEGGSASASCSLIENFCFLDCSAGDCPDGMDCETLQVGPSTVRVCNYP
jgi:hypothetical protein